ncbi:hypothetical protein QEN19_003128 [Hanseniaspora menglaensis]
MTTTPKTSVNHQNVSDETTQSIYMLNRALQAKTITLESLKESLQQEVTTTKFDLQKEADNMNSLIISQLNNFKINKARFDTYTKNVSSLEHLIDNNLGGNKKEDVQLMKFNHNLTLMNESIEFYTKFSTFEEDCAIVEGELDTLLQLNFADLEENDSHVWKVVEIHHSINELIKFEQVCKKLAIVSKDDSTVIIDKFFGKVESFTKIKAKFRELLKQITVDLIDLIRDKKFTVVLLYFKILENDIKEDLKIDSALKFFAKKQESFTIIKKINSKSTAANALAASYSSEKDTLLDEIIAQEIINGSFKTRLEPNNLTAFFVATLNDEVTEMFVNLEETYEINTASPNYEVLGNLDWVLNELYVVFDHLHKFAFPEFPVREIYFKIFYTHLNKLILKIISKEPDFVNLVSILQLDQNFIKTFEKGLKFKQMHWKAPSIIGEVEKDSLIEDYLTLLKLKMEEWFKNIHDQEVVMFLKRDKEPSLDEKNNLWLLDLKNLYQMFIQQMDLCSEIGYIKIFLGCFEMFTKLLLKRQRQWIDLVNREVRDLLEYNHKDDIKTKDATTLEIVSPAGGLLEYIIAVTNDQMKGADFTVVVQEKYGQLISKKHQEVIDSEVDNILDGFADVAKACTNGLIEIIMDDLKGNLQLILSSKWYVNDSDTLILQTLNILQDYLHDLKSFMNEYVFFTFIENLIEDFVINYIQSLNFKPLIVKKNIIIGFKKDLEMIFKFFQSFKENNSKDDVKEEDEEEDISFDEMLESKFKILEYFIDLICCPLNASNIDDFEMIWSNLVGSYYDCPISLVVRILQLRKEDIFDSSKVKLIISNCQALKEKSLKLQKDTSLDTNLVPTFVAKLHVQTK